eukprot:scaffold32452_cov31-Prasinocladus_malaysianus.AAC.1
MELRALESLLTFPQHNWSAMPAHHGLKGSLMLGDGIIAVHLRHLRGNIGCRCMYAKWWSRFPTQSSGGITEPRAPESLLTFPQHNRSSWSERVIDAWRQYDGTFGFEGWSVEAEAQTRETACSPEHGNQTMTPEPSESCKALAQPAAVRTSPSFAEDNLTASLDLLTLQE